MTSLNKTSFSSSSRSPLIDNKIALKYCSFLLYSYDRLEAENDFDTDAIQKQFFNVGGCVRNAAALTTNMFSNPKPGVRLLDYDPSNAGRNPIINESVTNIRSEFTFPGVDYIMVELPELKKKDPNKNHCLIFGGRKSPIEASQETDLTFIIKVNMSRIEKSKKTEKERFLLRDYLPENLDCFMSLLEESKTLTDTEPSIYIRGTFPLKRPLRYTKGLT